MMHEVGRCSRKFVKDIWAIYLILVLHDLKSLRGERSYCFRLIGEQQYIYACYAIITIRIFKKCKNEIREYKKGANES